ncbi:MAG: histidine phosphatase family protein [Candidatus Hodarchaeales archaeon]
MKLFLVRHGESTGNKNKIYQGHKDYPLSEKGKEQAIALRERMIKKGITPNEIYSSDLSRASQTADIINEVFNVPIYKYSGLRELDLGIYSGKHASEIKALGDNVIGKFFDDYSLKIPEGESINDMIKRIEIAFREIISRHENYSNGNQILIVAHGGTLFHILDSILKIFKPPANQWFDNCKMQEINRNPDGSWIIESFNEVPIQSLELNYN